jgi:hypothetical protein
MSLLSGQKEFIQASIGHIFEGIEDLNEAELKIYCNALTNAFKLEGKGDLVQFSNVIKDPTLLKRLEHQGDPITLGETRE